VRRALQLLERRSARDGDDDRDRVMLPTRARTAYYVTTGYRKALHFFCYGVFPKRAGRRDAGLAKDSQQLTLA